MYTAADAAELSLGFVGVKTPYDLAATAEEFDTALTHLNVLLAEIVGTKHFWWWTPVQQTFTLEVGVSEYNLDVKLVNGTPLHFVRRAQLKDSAGQVTPLTLIRRKQFDEEYEPAIDQGTPTRIYVERKNQPKLYTLGTPTVADTIVLTGLRYPEDISASGGDVDITFPDAWIRYIALRNAVDIGAGPVVSLPAMRHKRLVDMANAAERALNAFNNRENLDRARRTKYRDL